MDNTGGKLLLDAVAWIVAIAVLLITVLVLEMNIFLGLLIAVLVYAGLFLVLNPRSLAQELAQRRMMRKSTGSIVGCKVKLSQLRNLTIMLDDQSLRERVLKIAELGTDVISGLERKPLTPMYVVSRLNYIFDELVRLISGYLGFVTGKRSMAPAKLTALRNQLETGVLATTVETLEKYLADLDQEISPELEKTINVIEDALQHEAFA